MLKKQVLKVFLVLFARGSGVLVALAFSIFISRELGAVEAGTFFLALSIMMSLSAVLRLGVDNLLLRVVSVFWRDQEFANAESALFGAYKKISVLWLGLASFVTLSLIHI